MRLDKLTTKFQEALSDAQSLALGHDNAYIEPVHLLVAMLRQDDGPRALLERAGANVPGLLAAAEAAVKRLPQVTGQDQVQGGPELGRVLQATEKEAIKRDDNFIASELFLLALTDAKGDAARIAKENGLTRKSLEAAIEAVRGGQKMDSAEGEGQREALVWARRPSSKAWRSASSRARCPIRSRASACSRLTWRPCWRGPSSGASLKSA